jgi:hypothetical protein
MIRSDVYTSFSVLGLVIVFAIGGVLIRLECALERLAGWASEHWRHGTYQRLEWCANGTLQLQRLAHKAARWGTWTETTDLVPVARAGDILAALDLRDKEHPKLLPRDAADVVDGGGFTSLELLLPNENDAAAQNTG